jgi:hypothetical protein
MLESEAKVSELTSIFDQLSPARQEKVLNLARALLAEQAAPESTQGTGKRRGRPKGRKGSSYETTKTVKNGAGKQYRYRVHVTVDANGKRKEKYLGRVDQ